MTTRRGHSTPRALTRALSIVSLTAPMAALLVTGTAGPSWAASRGSLTVPTSVVTSGTSVSVKATEPSSLVTDTSGSLKVERPATTSLWTCGVRNGGSCTLAVPTDTANVPNGKWVATLTDNSGGGTTSKSFFTNFGPTATPAGLTTQATNPAPGATTGTIDLSWTYSGSEPDKWGFRVSDGNGWSADVTTSAASCDSSGACHYSKQYDNAPGSTTDYSFTVSALRSSCASAGCSVSGDTVEGSASSPATAQLVTPEPPPSPTPAPSASGSPAPGGTTGGTTGGTSGGSTPPTPGGLHHTDGGSTGTSGGAKPPAIVVPTLNPVVAQRKAFALGFNTFSPSLGIPKLPPLPATSFPETVGAASENTYQPTLPYKAQPAHTTTSFFSSPLGAVRSLDTQQLARSLAAALILLVAAAHVRLFLNAHRPD